jgi:3-(3-hydroxy-phenyl)propionate hydroxylase
VNSGRLSVPATLHGSVLNTPDGDEFEGRMISGSVALDAPVQLPDGSASWLLSQLGAGFTLMVYGADTDLDAPCHVVHIQPKNAARLAQENVLIDQDGLIAKRYDMQPGTAYLLRPDHHVCARWRQVTPAKLQTALDLALSKH